jgi:hypothetical protein
MASFTFNKLRAVTRQRCNSSEDRVNMLKTANAAVAAEMIGPKPDAEKNTYDIFMPHRFSDSTVPFNTKICCAFPRPMTGIRSGAHIVARIKHNPRCSIWQRRPPAQLPTNF